MTSSSIRIILLLVCWSTFAQAEGLNSLTLTPAEMQKLKQYFPVEEENQNLIWQGDPLTISLAKDKEKRLIFPSSVLVDVKGNLTTEQLRLVNNNQSLYLTALSAFPKTRIYVTLQESGEVILIDLIVDGHTSHTTQTIQVVQRKLDLQKNALVQDTEKNTVDILPSSNKTEEVSTVDLVRFAYQQLYAPLRLQQTDSLYTRIATKTDAFVPDLVYGDKVIAHPIASWVGGNRYITAVALQNKYSHTTHIDIRHDLCGDWQAAVLYPRATLLFHGEHIHDSTTLFLVSQKSFSETLGVCHGNA